PMRDVEGRPIEVKVRRPLGLHALTEAGSNDAEPDDKRLPPPDQEAPIRAAERADDLLEAGDIEGAAIWRAILDAIEELQRGPEPGEMVN
ncbi:MAG TPA: hypothetical protein VKB42_23140, partial [Dongiaceae bacterium]|nr:hypothetical protein [Dongiaceae bacterium]